MAPKSNDFNIKQRQLNEDIQNGTFKSCYLLYGEEAYLRYQYRDKLLAALGVDSSSMNYNVYRGDKLNAPEIVDMAETLPFLADKRVILVEDSGFFKTGCPELSEYLKNPAGTVVFLFVEKEVDKRKDIYKAVSKNGFEICCEINDDNMIKRWIAQRVRGEGKEISPSAVALLLDRVGTDMSNLLTEIEKLVSYCIDRKEIGAEDINAVCANYLTGRIFEMTDAIVEKNQKRAIELYYDLLALKEPPAKIMALIIRQFNLMLQIKEMADNRKSGGQIASDMGMAPFLVGKYVNWARGYSFDELRGILEMCADSDRAVKTGNLDYIIGTEMVIIKCTA